MSVQVTRIDILKMLLYAPGPTGRVNEPILGRTRLQKEVFLMQKALADKKIKRLYPFMPYYYGPFSRELYRDLSWLEYKDLIRERTFEKNNDGIYREFKLTPKGTTEVQALIDLEKMRDIYETVKDIKQRYNLMPLARLVSYTHKTWPEYMISSLSRRDE